VLELDCSSGLRKRLPQRELDYRVHGRRGGNQRRDPCPKSQYSP